VGITAGKRDLFLFLIKNNRLLNRGKTFSMAARGRRAEKGYIREGPWGKAGLASCKCDSDLACFSASRKKRRKARGGV